MTWHAAVVASFQGYAQALASDPSLELTLLIPPSWDELTKDVKAEKTEDPR
ncbi:MAG: guanylate kinase, partial [Armatimonadetes bacterium]|nr:guanylate kinase [Armatimonadota bacterium]